MNQLDVYLLSEDKREPRITELQEQLRLLQALPATDWHAGCGAYIGFATSECTDVDVMAETELGVEPPRTDFLVTLGEGATLAGDVFRGFTKYNVVEYKGPGATVNSRTLHKVIGYANYLIGIAKGNAYMPADQVTITLLHGGRESRHLKSLLRDGSLVKGSAPGVYWLTKEVSNLPFQVVVTCELEGDENVFLRALSEHPLKEDLELIVRTVHGCTDETAYEYGRVYLELLSEKSPEAHDIMKEDKYMCTALMDIVKDKVDEKIEETSKELTLRHIKNLVENTGCSPRQAMDSLGIAADQRDKYMAMLSV